MTEFKSQPINIRSKKPFWIRIAFALVLFPLFAFLTSLLVPPVLEKFDREGMENTVKIVVFITYGIMMLRYLYSTNIRKWCYAYIQFVYDAMLREDTMKCPRCQTYLENTSDGDNKTRQCQNTNCRMSLKNRFSFSQMPATKRSSEALVMNRGIYDDFKTSVSATIVSLVVNVIVTAAAAFALLQYAIPYIKDLL